jgi:Ca-activated chloride channel homolog
MEMKAYKYLSLKGEKSERKRNSGSCMNSNRTIEVFLFLLISISISGYITAQSKRSLINEGVDKYKTGNFTESENNFKKALDKDQELFEGHFNLGDALYKMGKYDEAMNSYKNSMGFTESPVNKAKVFHNIGNSLLKSQKYQESIDAYKNALKLNPNDPETKYNLSYALNMLKQEQQKKKQDKKDNKEKNKDKDKQDQKNQDQQKPQDNKDKKQDQDKQQQQPQKNQISKSEAERILSALKNKESDLQKKLRQRKARIVPKEKDW